MPAEPRQLRIEYATEEAFREEYASNIANGGIFVSTKTPFCVRDPVRVEITLGYCGESIALDGEVVHCVPLELAETGATPGVAVQFRMPAREIRERLEPLAGPLEETNERIAQSGRRRAPRAAARVMATVKTGEREVEVRTRNLSSTGVLVSVDGDAIPVGQVVKLSIANPTSGEEMEIEGRVMRHLETEEGEVAAVGIQFQAPEARQAEVNRFVSDVKAAEHSRRLGGISGAISEIGIENLLQMFGTCATQGTLIVNNGPSEGFIAFEQGQLRKAQVGSDCGIPALAVMLSWKEGSFEFQARVDVTEFAEAPLPLEGAILDAMRQADGGSRADDGAAAEDADADPVALELDALEEELIEVDDDLLAHDLLSDEPNTTEVLFDLPETFPAEACLGIETDAGESVRHELNKTEQAVLDLAQVGMSVGKVLEVIPEPPEALQAVIRSLVERGLLAVD
ncbi:MAG: PilZ domain-containing protein [Proteobacteria bacterium]|nr:PilZ domain-containing protein [Pseudomonadota bacterium]